MMFYTSISFSQEYTLLDFGSLNAGSPSLGNWNNIVVTTQNQSGGAFSLIDYLGMASGVTLTINDSFDLINNSGTTNPDSNLPFLDTATKDSFFGEVNSFNGNINPTGGFVLSNLDPSKYYSFSVFASRMGVSDNRETLYTVTGQNNASITLNVSNNESNTADIFNIQPLNDGTITFVATKGTNNNNSFGFYYLGAIKMVTSATPISDINPPILSLIYPNGGELWEVSKTPFISWESQNISNVTIEYSIDNGNNWSTLITVPASDKKYIWTIPNSISTLCKIRIYEGTNTDISDASFSIIANEGTVYKIVVLGSSTAAGTGPSDINNAWVWRYNDFLTQTDTRYFVENLAVGGFATYNILPTGATIPMGINRTIDTEKNVTKALSLNANGIIVNLPSNDAASEYPTADQIANYHLIRNTALAQNVPVWIGFPQPRDFGSNTNALNIQLEMVTETPIEFGTSSFDFWTDLGIIGGNGIDPLYDTDGVHMNDAGHQILFDRIVAKDIHTTIKNLVDASLSIDSSSFSSKIKTYPNPFKNELNIKFNLKTNSTVKVSILDAYGRIVSKIIDDNRSFGDNVVTWHPLKNSISKGIYFCKIIADENSITKKIIFN